MFFSGIADEAGESIETQIKAHQELGWKHIELRNVGGLNVTDVCDEYFEGIADKLADAGLAVSNFASQLCNWARPIHIHPDIDMQELRRAIPRMKEMGCDTIRIMSYPNAGWEESKWRDEVLKRISRLTDVAEDNDIVLLHENCDGWGGLGVQQTLAMIEHVDSPNLKLIWDTGNPVAHDQDAWEYYKGVREHVIYIHIKDGVRENGKVRYTFPGEGEGAVKDVLQDLIERDYRGCISIEPHISAVIHEGKSAETEHDSFNTYVEYGKRLMGLIESLG